MEGNHHQCKLLRVRTSTGASWSDLHQQHATTTTTTTDQIRTSTAACQWSDRCSNQCNLRKIKWYALTQVTLIAASVTPTAPVLATFDQELHLILVEILNVNLDAHSTWIQATLPVGEGGLGIHRSTQLAPSAFLASAAGCKDLLIQILPNRLKDTTPPYVLEVCSEWKQGHQ